MFGYVKPFVPRLTVADHELYKAVYCGVCRAMKRQGCGLLRLGLSYDFVFCALFYAAASGERFAVTPFRCALHPFKKRQSCLPGKAVDDAAATALALMDFKALDDAADARGFARLRARLLAALYRRPVRRLRREHPGLYEIAEQCAGRQKTVENDPAAGVDLAADPSAQALGRLLARAEADPETAEAAADFGYLLGRWVYLIDAADDAEADEKRGGFNPLLYPENRDPSRKKEILNLCLTEVDRRWHKLPSQYHHPILDNIIEAGLPAVQKRVLDGPEAGERPAKEKHGG